LNVASWFIADAVKAPIMVEDKKLVEKKQRKCFIKVFIFAGQKYSI
jgi:hypothetical protein